ncbi:MAG: hypothetical protein Q9182_001808 [Xanthomendoza sp. 2 TL-2023]
MSHAFFVKFSLHHLATLRVLKPRIFGTPLHSSENIPRKLTMPEDPRDPARSSPRYIDPRLLTVPSPNPERSEQAQRSSNVPQNTNTVQSNRPQQDSPPPGRVMRYLDSLPPHEFLEPQPSPSTVTPTPETSSPSTLDSETTSTDRRARRQKTLSPFGTPPASNPPSPREEDSQRENPRSPIREASVHSGEQSRDTRSRSRNPEQSSTPETMTEEEENYRELQRVHMAMKGHDFEKARDEHFNAMVPYNAEN